MTHDERNRPEYEQLNAELADTLRRRGLLTEDVHVVESPDEVKMSAVILKLAEPLLERYATDENRVRTAIFLTVYVWNMLMLPEPDRRVARDRLIDEAVPPNGDAQDVGSILYLVEWIEQGKERHYPDLRKLIVDYDVRIGGGELTLDVKSAPIPST